MGCDGLHDGGLVGSESWGVCYIVDCPDRWPGWCIVTRTHFHLYRPSCNVWVIPSSHSVLLMSKTPSHTQGQCKPLDVFEEAALKPLFPCTRFSKSMQDHLDKINKWDVHLRVIFPNLEMPSPGPSGWGDTWQGHTWYSPPSRSLVNVQRKCYFGVKTLYTGLQRLQTSLGQVGQ